MTTETTVTPLESVVQGLLLAEDIVNASGQVLVGSGTELTPKLCDSLKKRGIEEVCVKSATPKLSQDEVCERLDKLFLQTEKTETMATLRAMLERFHSGVRR